MAEKSNRILNGISGLAYGISLASAILGIGSSFHYERYTLVFTLLGGILILQLLLVAFVFEFSKHKNRKEFDWVKLPVMVYLLLNGVFMYILDSHYFDSKWDIGLGTTEVVIIYLILLVCLLFWGYKRYNKK